MSGEKTFGLSRNGWIFFIALFIASSLSAIVTISQDSGGIITDLAGRFFGAYISTRILFWIRDSLRRPPPQQEEDV